MAKRKALIHLRVDNDLSQEQMAARLGINRVNYSRIELGESGGSKAFWERLQAEFGIPDEEMWAIYK